MSAIFSNGQWVDSATGQPSTPTEIAVAQAGGALGGANYTLNPAQQAAANSAPNPWGTGASSATLGPNGLQQTSGAGVATPSTLAGPGGGGAGGGGGSNQSSDIFGTGQFRPQPYAGFDPSLISGSPTQGGAANYGLNGVWDNLQTAVTNLAPRNYAATAPSATAAQGSAAQAAAAQGAASGYGATTGNASGYGASTGNASGYSAATGQASVYGAGSGKASAYDAATGGASNLAASSGQAATGNSAYVTGPATIGGAARSGYAMADPTHISTAGDLAWQGQQQGLANTLATQANGGGVSPADLQLKQGTEQQIAGQLAVLGSQRGATDFGMAQRSASQGAATSEAQLNQQMGIQRAQETLQAQQALGNVLGTARGQAQNYNVNQADLLQALKLQNAGFAQQSGLANANLSQSAAEFNAGNAQAANLFNAGNAQQMTQANMAARNAMLSQNVQQAQAANQYSAGNSQQAMLANMLAANQANQFNAGQSQAMTSENLAAQNQAAQFNAANSQAMISQDIAAQNQAAQYTAGNSQQMQIQNLLAQNQAGQFNAGNSQQMQLANLGAQNTANQFNAGNAQGMTLADMLAQNQMTGANLNAQNEFGLANLGNQQQTSLANLGLAGQYGLANQQAGIASQNQYNQQLMALLGAQTGIGQSNRAAQLSSQQLGVQQQVAMNQISAEQYTADAQAKANLTGGVLSAGASLLSGLASGLISQAVNAAGQTVYTDSRTGYTTTNPSDPGLFTDSPTDPNVAPPTPSGPQQPLYGDTSGTTPADGSTGTTTSNLSSASDENMKTGISGGNPMLDSFLQQYRESRGKDANAINPDEGLGFHVQRYAQALSGGTPGKDSFSNSSTTIGNIAGAAGSALGSMFGPIAGAAGGAAASAFGNADVTPQAYVPTVASAGKQTSSLASPAIGLEKIDVTNPDDDPYGLSSMSDDREKEAVMSGNRGVQSFLEQANAQQTAQNQSGAQSNAFMQNGAPPNPQVDRQMPGDTSAGYGQMGAVNAPQFAGQFGGASVTGMGGFGGGGLASEGGYQGGGWAPASQQSAGGWTPAAQTGNAYSNGAYELTAPRGFDASQAGYGSVSAAGEQRAGSYFGGGMTSMGGVGQGPSVSAGGLTGGSNASQGPTPVMSSAPVNGPAQPVFNVRNLGPDPATLAPARFPNYTAPAPVQPFIVRSPGPDPATLTPASFPTFTPSFSSGPSGGQGTPTSTSSIYGSANGSTTGTRNADGSPIAAGPNLSAIASPQGQANINAALPQVDWNSVLSQANTTPMDTSAITSPQGQANIDTSLSGGFDLSSYLPGGANYVPQAPPSWVQSMGGALSDEKEKTDIHNPDPAQLGDLLDHLHAHQYRYKDPSAPGAGAGTYVSPMAQELEQTDLGKNFVFQGPNGRKMVDYGKMAGTQLAATSMLHERVSGLEDLLKRSAAMQPQGSR